MKDVGEFVFAAVLAFYGVLGYHLFRDQLRVMQQQTKVMQDQLADARAGAVEQQKTTDRVLKTAERQADALTKLVEANKTMADAAKQHAYTAKTTLANLVESDRPVIGVTEIGSNTTVLEPDKEVVVTFRISNTGRRPADVYLTEFTIRLLERFPQDPLATLGRPTTEPSRLELMPGAGEQIAVHAKPTSDEIESIRSGKKILYAWGHVDYRDVVTKRCRSYHLCSFYLPDRTGMQACKPYNETVDVACPKQQ